MSEFRARVVQVFDGEPVGDLAHCGVVGFSWAWDVDVEVEVLCDGSPSFPLVGVFRIRSERFCETDERFLEDRCPVGLVAASLDVEVCLDWLRQRVAAARGDSAEGLTRQLEQVMWIDEDDFAPLELWSRVQGRFVRSASRMRRSDLVVPATLPVDWTEGDSFGAGPGVLVLDSDAIDDVSFLSLFNGCWRYEFAYLSVAFFYVWCFAGGHISTKRYGCAARGDSGGTASRLGVRCAVFGFRTASR